MKLFYRQLGEEGSSVLVAHGLYGASDNWVTIARELALSHRVFLLDLRNHGKSPHSNQHSYEAMAKDVVELIDDLNLIKPALVGHSMGGKVMMQTALLYPHKVSRLAVLDIAPKSYANFQNYGLTTNNHAAIIQLMRSIDFGLFTSRQEIEQSVHEQINDEAIANFLLKNIIRHSNGSYGWKLNVEALHANLNEILDGFSHLFSGETPRFNGETLFLRGEKSAYFLDEDLHVARKLFPRAELSTLPNCGHWLHAEQPQLVKNSLLYFLE